MKKVIMFALLLLFVSGNAWAHKVLIYAWVDGDTVYTESKFGSGRKARASDVSVYGPDGVVLVSGKTDDVGSFNFPVPEKAPLKVVINAGPGHRGEWVIPAEDLEKTEDADTSMTVSSADLADGKPAAGDMKTAEDAARGRSLTEDDLAAIRDIIDESVDRKMVPVKRFIAESTDPGPSAKDIFGGLGYIMGIAGIGSYVAGRKKNKGGL